MSQIIITERGTSREPCPYCRDTGRMDNPECDLDDDESSVVDCDNCDSNSFHCAGCSHSDCPKCKPTSP